MSHINSALDRHTEAIDNISRLLAEREPRFMVIEEQGKFTREIVNELKQGQRELVKELREMNMRMRFP